MFIRINTYTRTANIGSVSTVKYKTENIPDEASADGAGAVLKIMYAAALWEKFIVKCETIDEKTEPVLYTIRQKIIPIKNA